MIIAALGKPQKASCVFIHSLYRINDIGKKDAVGIPRKNISPLPAADALDEPRLGKGGEQLPEIFVRDMQCIDKMKGRKYLKV
jgi:hypothetical protein